MVCVFPTLGVHVNVYGGEPLPGLAVAVPSHVLLQDVFVFVIFACNAAGVVMEKSEVAEQLLESVTTKE